MSMEKFNGITDELKNRFKALLKEFNVVPVVQSPVTTPDVKKFGELELEDGSIIKWEGEMPLAVGVPLMVIDPVNPEGFLPIPDGTYTAKDGSVIVVTEGIVSEFTPSVAPVAPIVEPGMTAQIATLRDELEALKSKFSSVEKTEVESLKSEIELLKSENQNFKTALEKSNSSVKEMFSIMEVALDVPQSEPIVTPIAKSAFSKKDRLIKLLNN